MEEVFKRGARGRFGEEMHRRCELWCARDQCDPYIGTLVNAWLAHGGHAKGVRAGSAYVDVGTLYGYREAIALLQSTPSAAPTFAAGE